MNIQSFKSNLDKVANQFGIANYVLDRILAIAIVEQIFFETAKSKGFDAYLKGGSSLVWKFGPTKVRATSDIDAVLDLEREQVLGLIRGLEGSKYEFCTISKVTIGSEMTKAKVPGEYRIVPAALQLKLWESSWVTVRLEVLPMEDTFNGAPKSLRAADELNQLLVACGFPGLGQIPIMATESQVAEKLHALTEPKSDRASDLFDVAFLAREEDLNYERLAQSVSQVFKRRDVHPWNPDFELTDTLRVGFSDDWGSLSLADADELVTSVIEAISKRIHGDG